MVSAPTVSAPSSTLPLEVNELVKSFGAVKAVAGVSLKLHPAECLGLLGPNGAGKSTVIRGIVGRVLPDSGTISVFGAPADSSAARASLGWVPQDLAVYPRLTCKENLLAFGRYHGMTGSKLLDAVAWCLGWAALEDKATELAKNLSGGMKRRLNMAAGIIHRPRVVLMDEPTVGVDPQSRNRIFEMIEAPSGFRRRDRLHHPLHGRGGEQPLRPHRHHRSWFRIIIALGTNEELVHAVFASRSQVTARFAGDPAGGIASWVERRGGRMVDSSCTVHH